MYLLGIEEAFLLLHLFQELHAFVLDLVKYGVTHRRIRVEAVGPLHRSVRLYLLEAGINFLGEVETFLGS